MTAILDGEFHIDSLMERVDETERGQVAVYKVILRDEAGRKLSILQGEPFERVAIGAKVHVRVERVAGGLV